MFQHALLPTDLTSSAQILASCLNGFRRLGLRKVTLVHVVNVASSDRKQTDIGKREEQLEEQKDLVAKQGFESRAEIRVGLPAVEISRSAREHGASFILLNAREYSPVCDIPLGSVAAEALQQSTIPILLINFNMEEEGHDRQCAAACNNLLGHILCATDFSPSSDRALSFLEKLVESGNRKISLLHVQDKERIEPYLKDKLDDFNKTDRERLENDKNRLSRKGASEVHVDILYGSPKQEIQSRCEQNGVSLIVLGKGGRGSLDDTSLGSVSQFVIRRTHRPVLLVPESSE
ncbi:MAG: universal stress protein [Opitutales bacterium]